MPLIVQKYGGSSLANAAAIVRISKRIVDAQEKGGQIVAVVSAMGDTTNDLTALAYQVSERPDPRELDVLLSTGELVSCTLLAMALRSQRLDAISLSGAQAGIRTDTSYGRAKIASIDPGRILSELEKGQVVIVAGFQGMTDAMDITTLGRGASDVSAVAIAARLGADRCEIYTDVEGIYTADPSLVPEARKLDKVEFEEMLELASYGAKMNPRSIELGMVYNVPIIVAASFTDRPGTLIYQGANMKTNVGEIRNRVRGIATDGNVTKITVQGVVDRPGIAAGLFESLADADISVDVIVQNASTGGATDITFTVRSTDLDEALSVVEEAARDLGASEVSAAGNLAKVSIVGTGMQDVPGYAGKMFRALADANINIEMIATSEIRITCIVDEGLVQDAARALHVAFQLEQLD